MGHGRSIGGYLIAGFYSALNFMYSVRISRWRVSDLLEAIIPRFKFQNCYTQRVS
jgi:hypothetical protein